SLVTARTELAVLGRRIEVLTADLSAPDGAERLCDEVLLSHAPIDILVNNVGGRRENIPTETMPLETWQRLIDLNLTSVFICTKRIGGTMLPRRWGRVINIASICGQIATRNI